MSNHQSGYCYRWEQLAVGSAGELDIRAKITALSVELSREHGIRVSIYVPSLDMDNNDFLLRLQTKKWIVFFQSQVRRRSKGGVPLGKSTKPGTLNNWADVACNSNVPVILFTLDGSGKYDFFETRRLRRTRTIAGSVPAPACSAEEFTVKLRKFLLAIAGHQDQTDARAAIARTVAPYKPAAGKERRTK